MLGIFQHCAFYLSTAIDFANTQHVDVTNPGGEFFDAQYSKLPPSASPYSIDSGDNNDKYL